MDADPVIANNSHIETAFLPPDNSRYRDDPDIFTAAYCTLTNQISKNKLLVLDMICDNIQHLSYESSPTNSQNASEENSPTNSRYLREQEQENSRKRKKSNEYSELLTSPILYEGQECC
jgi:hypothetical protein